MNPNPPALSVENLSVAYQKKVVLEKVTFSLPQSQLVGVIGPNGAGKSTLLKAAMQLVPTLSGKVQFLGETLDAVRKKVAYVPQRESVDWDFPASVYDVALMGRYPHLGLFRRPTAIDREIARQSLEQVGLTDLASRQIGQLSGGQQQRVFIARALAQQAELYLLDEPFAGVDAASEASIVELLRQLCQTGKTVVVVHHDLNTARSIFDRIVLINQTLVAEGAASEVLRLEILQKAYRGLAVLA